MSSRKTYYGEAITDKEFYTQACRWADTSNVQTASKWWNAFLEVIIREVYYNGTVRLPDLGTFKVKKIKEHTQTQKSANGKTTVYKVPARVLPVFVPHDNFIDDINMEGVTKAYRKRLNNDKLTSKDLAREARADSMGVKRNRIVGASKRAKGEKELKKYLVDKKKQYKGRVEPENDEE